MWITSRYGSDHCQIGLKHWTMINDLSWFLLSHLISVYSLIVCWCLVTTPLKINGWYIIMEVCFRSCSFLFMGDGCRFLSPLIFQGVRKWSICQHPRLDRSSVEQSPIHPIHLEFMSTLDVRRWEVQQFAPEKWCWEDDPFLRYLFRCYVSFMECNQCWMMSRCSSNSGGGWMLEDSCQTFFCLKHAVLVGKNWIKLTSVADQCFQSLFLKDVT